jgi:N-acetylglucosamine kinase-like BadF-type ATPase
LQYIWRNEDRAGYWRQSRLAQSIFHQIGSHDWQRTKTVYHRSRGDIGKLALGVAAVASQDTVAADILWRAGQELARLAISLCQRYGPRPVVLSGRVQELHPLITESLRKHLPSEISPASEYLSGPLFYGSAGGQTITRHTMKRLLAVALLAGLLSACSTPAPVLTQIDRSVVSVSQSHGFSF